MGKMEEGINDELGLWRPALKVRRSKMKYIKYRFTPEVHYSLEVKIKDHHITSYNYYILDLLYKMMENRDLN